MSQATITQRRSAFSLTCRENLGPHTAVADNASIAQYRDLTTEVQSAALACGATMAGP